MGGTVKTARVATFRSQTIGQALGNRHGRKPPAFQRSRCTCAGRRRCPGPDVRGAQCCRARHGARPCGRHGGPGHKRLPGRRRYSSAWRFGTGCPSVRQGGAGFVGPAYPHRPRHSGGFSATPGGQHGRRRPGHGVSGPDGYRPAARGIPDGAVGVPGPQLAFRLPDESADGLNRRFPPRPGLRSALWNHGVRRGFRRGPGCGLASVGRRQPGGDRPWRRADHHLQPSGVHRSPDRGHSAGGPSHRPGGLDRVVHRLPPAP